MSANFRRNMWGALMKEFWIIYFAVNGSTKHTAHLCLLLVKRVNLRTRTASDWAKGGTVPKGILWYKTTTRTATATINWGIRAPDQECQSPFTHRGDLNLIPGLSMWGSLWIKWHRRNCSLCTSGPLSGINRPTAHTHISLICRRHYIEYNLSNWQHSWTKAFP